MRIKTWKQIIERKGFDHIDNIFDDEDDAKGTYDPYDDGFTLDEEEIDEEEIDGNVIDDEDDDFSSSDDADMHHLLSLLRQMFENVGIDVNVVNSEADIEITTTFNRRESISYLVKVFEVAKKLEKDILGQYDSLYEVWWSKKGYYAITFYYNLGDPLDDRDSPFNG